jgi:hypothetical protein
MPVPGKLQPEPGLTLKTIRQDTSADRVLDVERNFIKQIRLENLLLGNLKIVTTIMKVDDNL